jgi:hypothetical protein
VLLGLEQPNRAGDFDDACVETGDLGCHSRQHLAIALDPFAQLLDLTPGRENATRLDFRTAGHEMGSAEHVALDGGDWRKGFVREGDGLLEALGDVRLRDHFQNGRRVGTVHAQHIRHRHDARRAKSVVWVVSVRPRLDDNEAAATCVLLPHEGQAGSRLVVALDNHVLKQVAETGFDRALVAAIDLEEIRDGSLLTDVPVGLHQNHPGGIAEVGAAGGQLFERREPALDRGQLLLACAQVARPLFVLALRHRELRASLHNC